MKSGRYEWWPAHDDPSKDESMVHAMEFSTRAFNALVAGDLITVRRIRRTPDREMLKIENLGKKTLAEIRALVPFQIKEGETEITWSFGWGWIGFDDKPRIRVRAA